MILYIADRNIRVDNADNQISYNSDYIAEFHFDEEWNGKVKTARFVQNGEYSDVVLIDDRCEIPPLKTGFVRIGVFSDSMTSTYADVYFKTSIKDGTGIPAEPPEDVYAQLTALIESGILKGDDGLTPYVGENNNWWIGDVDTGILARGYTPVKGTDYFTDSEVKQIQNEVSSGAIGEFRQVVDSKTNEFNSNASEKLTSYNQNDSEKTEAYNSNAQAKVADYNTNADNRVAEFNAQTEQIQTDISGLKSDLANKLPKSPADWEQWTAEEQAMARARIGLGERLIFSKTLEEDVKLMFVRNDMNGNKFKLSEINIYIYSPVSVNNDPTNGYVSVNSSNNDNWENLFGAWTFKSKDYEGVASAKFVASEYHRSYSIFTDCMKTTVASRAYQMVSYGRFNQLHNDIVGIRLMVNGTLEAGTEIVIMGVDK